MGEMSRIILVATADYVWVESAREIIAYLGGLRNAVVYTNAYKKRTFLVSNPIVELNLNR